MNYNFSKDLADGKIAQKRVAELFQQKCSQIVSVEYNNDYRYDILFRLDDNRIVTVQVKRDYLLHQTGNFAIETECRGKPSGINVTQADFFVIYTDNPEHAYAFKTSYLKMLSCDKKYHTVIGGDNGNTTSMVLIPKCLINSYRDVVELKEIRL